MYGTQLTNKVTLDTREGHCERETVLPKPRSQRRMLLIPIKII
jgi:hypothetical protein